MIRWHFHDKHYRIWLLFVIGTGEELLELLEEIEYKETSEVQIKGAKGMLLEITPENNELKNDCYVLWLPKFDTAVLLHELAHLVMFVFRRVGVPMTIDNTEPFAFYQEFWYTEITRTRRRKPLGQKPKEARK